MKLGKGGGARTPPFSHPHFSTAPFAVERNVVEATVNSSRHSLWWSKFVDATVNSPRHCLWWRSNFVEQAISPFQVLEKGM